MPIYEFECNKCKDKFELLIRSHSAAAVCPACSSVDLKRLMSAFAFASKNGSGDIARSSGCGSCTGGNCSSCAR
jgi:putative FmdB family regulatory protein